MRFLLVIIFISAGLVGCKNNNKIPDVSDIKIELTTQRFEKDLFSSDSLQLPANLDKLIARYPSFGENFLTTILNTDPHWAADSATAYINSFISAYRPLYDSSQKLFFEGVVELAKTAEYSGGPIINTGDIRNLTQGVLALVAGAGSRWPGPAEPAHRPVAPGPGTRLRGWAC